MIKTGYSRRKRSDGLWMSWVWDSPKGKRHYLYDKDRNALRIRTEDYASKLQDGNDLDATTLADYSAMFLEKHKAEYAKSTFKAYKSMHDNHIASSDLGRMWMTDIKHSDIQALIAKTETKKKTMQNIIGYIRTLFTTASNDGLLKYNPAIGRFKYKQELPYQYRLYTMDDLKKLIKSYREDDLNLVPILLASLCGMRLGECMALRGEAVDLQNGIISVNLNAVAISSSIDIKPPKTANSVRKIYAPAIVMQKLAKIWRPGFLFSNDGGKTPWNGATYSLRFRNHIFYRHLPPTRFHDLRHFSATMLMANGLPDKQIASFLGHADANITKRYQHIMENVEKKPAEIFNDLIQQD